MVDRAYSIEMGCAIRRAAHLAAALRRELDSITASGAVGIWDVAAHPERFRALKREVDDFCEARARAIGLSDYLVRLDGAAGDAMPEADRLEVLNAQPSNPFEGWKA